MVCMVCMLPEAVPHTVLITMYYVPSSHTDASCVMKRAYGMRKHMYGVRKHMHGMRKQMYGLHAT
jgi:hypothetical protein